MSFKYVHECKNSAKCHEANHLCQIVIQRDLGRIKELVKGARFFCKNCGRAAREAENLCNPSKI